jgi:hypothetical protein
VVKAVALVAGAPSGLNAREMQVTADAVADLTSWYWSRGKSLNNPFAEKKTYAVLEALDGDGVAHYILGSNGKGVTAEIARDLQRMMPDLIIAKGIGKHAEIEASKADFSVGLSVVFG